MKKRLTAVTIAIIAFITIMFGSELVHLYTDWLWFQEIGYPELFLTPIKAKLAIGAIVGLATFVLLYINIVIALGRQKTDTTAFRFIGGQLQVDVAKYTKPIAILAIAALSILTAFAAGANWETILQYFNATQFGTIDTVFSKDLGFYFFSLPVIQLALGLISWVIILSLITAIVLYGSNGSISKSSRLFSLEPKTRIHLSILVALFFATIALRTWYVKIPNLLYSTTGPFTGASYTDLHANLPLLKFLAILAGLVAIVSFVSSLKKKYSYAIASILIYVAVGILGRAYPAAIQKFVVAPNELVKESIPIARNIEATQKAFGLRNVEERDLKDDMTLTKKDIEENYSTINNIRLWDREPLLDTFGQLQEIRTYYTFASIDNDRYQVNGEYRQVLLSPRELDTGSLPSDTFINKHLAFTHGYGLTLGPVNETTSEGLPLLFVKDIPPNQSKDFNIIRPEIYFGELSQDPVFVKTQAQEFDYPSGDQNVFSEYKGTGGVPIKNTLRKALFALRFSSLKMLLSNDIVKDSRAMYYRDINERVARALPFLQFDNDPYMVITQDGRLKWIYDAYTTSNKYPYSEKIFTGINYIRNSIKIVIDAYDGSMKFYVSDPNDPIINTYKKIFPNSFVSLSEMSEDLKAHLRYPEDLFAYQTALYQTYHMQEPQIFYNKEDEWQIPAFGKLEDPIMRHLIMKLPGEKQEEFILMIPFTPKGKDNLAAWMVARSDGENYGKLAVYRFPKQKLVFGPKQIMNRINQDAEISGQLSLWDQKGSQVIHGNLLVIPIEKSLLYVEPLYLKAEGGKIPELKRVIVAYENQIAMEETLDMALAKIFSGVMATPKQIPTENNLLRQAQTYYENALNAQRSGNWAQYGEEIQKLGEVLKKMNK